MKQKVQSPFCFVKNWMIFFVLPEEKAELERWFL